MPEEEMLYNRYYKAVFQLYTASVFAYKSNYINMENVDRCIIWELRKSKYK